MTGTAGASNPQVRNEIRPSPQVARSAPRTLSRWRHGFKSRWDYKSKTTGQGTSPDSISWLNPDSNARYPANIPHRIERSDRATFRARRGWMHSRGRPVPHPGQHESPPHPAMTEGRAIRSGG
jgi:hypothetical protein